jgi:hypothetical protein
MYIEAILKPLRLSTCCTIYGRCLFKDRSILTYVSHIFLHRKFIPCLPLQTTEPAGPINPPLFNSEAPAGWWESSSKTLHDAADSVANILSELRNAGSPILSPLVGFCAFSAAVTQYHVAAFPHVNLGRSTDPGLKAEACFLYLTEFGKIFKIGKDWVCLQSFSTEKGGSN